MPYDFHIHAQQGTFVERYIRFAAQCTDASWDFHEGAAYWLMGNVTHNMRAPLNIYPDGLPTNLYILLIGPSSFSRKSTCMTMARKMITAAIPNGLIAEKMSPEGFMEALAGKSGAPAGWIMDEFTSLIAEMHDKPYMASMKELLMSVYSGMDYEYRRHSKRIQGGVKEKDYDKITKPHLSILGGCTPTIFSMIHENDIESGLLPRFVIILPDTKPAREPFHATTPALDEEKRYLEEWLKQIYQFSLKNPPVNFSPEAIGLLNQFDVHIEGSADESEHTNLMRKRLVDISVKLSVLNACSHMEVLSNMDITVSETDAEIAVKIARKWQVFAERFADNITSGVREQRVMKLRKILKRHPLLDRRKAMQWSHASKRELDEAIETLTATGELEMMPPGEGGRHPVLKYLGVNGNGNGSHGELRNGSGDREPLQGSVRG